MRSNKITLDETPEQYSCCYKQVFRLIIFRRFILGPPGSYEENNLHSSIWRQSIRTVQKLLQDLSSLRTIISIWIPSNKGIFGFARHFRKQGEDVPLFGKLCEKSSQLIWELDFLPAVPKLSKVRFSLSLNTFSC